jgi:pseudouridine synthase
MTRPRIRLQKFLSRAGVVSRRKGEILIVQGRVKVNGALVTELGSRVDPVADRVEVDDRIVRLEPLLWIMLNKPRGVLTTRADEAGRRTVYDLLDPVHLSLRYVGRLDRDTEGLLLFTNEGDLQHALLHPSAGVARTYIAQVEGVPDARSMRRLEEGVTLDDGPAQAERVRLTKVRGDRSFASVSLVVREGRNREVRRLLAGVGHEVKRLRRVGFGPLALEDLGPGKWRTLRPDEITTLRRLAAGRGDDGTRRGMRGSINQS